MRTTSGSDSMLDVRDCKARRVSFACASFVSVIYLLCSACTRLLWHQLASQQFCSSTAALTSFWMATKRICTSLVWS